MNAHADFTVQIIPRKNVIKLSGQMTGAGLSAAAEQELGKLAGHPRGNKWTVDAEQASILRGGAQLWVEIVNRFLAGCDLVYPPSQLALVLLCDDDYRSRYPGTVFLEEELITPT